MGIIINSLLAGLKKACTVFANSYTTTKIAVACMILVATTVEIHTHTLAAAASHEAFTQPYITMCSPHRIFNEMMEANSGHVQWLRVSSLITYMSGVVTVVLAIFVFITSKVFGNIYMIAVICIHNLICVAIFAAFYMKEVYHDSTGEINRIDYEFLLDLAPISLCNGFKANFRMFVHNHHALNSTFYLCGKINILLGVFTIILCLCTFVDSWSGRELHPVLNYELRPCVAKSCLGGQPGYTSPINRDVEAAKSKTMAPAAPEARKFLVQNK